MRDLITMWGNTRMIVLTAITGSLYAAILIPFKVLPIIPGVTELRPANAVPVICSFLFGPAAAWGAGIGNVIGDFFGGIGPGSLFGFLGNFLYGYLPYKAWEALSLGTPNPRRPLHLVALTFVILIASGACALTIGWGLNLLGFVPFAALGNIILVNNFVLAALLTPLLVLALYPRVAKARLLYTDVMTMPNPRSLASRRFGLLLLVAAIVAGMVVGNLLSSGSLVLPAEIAGEPSATRALQVGLGLLPIILVLFLALLIL